MMMYINVLLAGHRRLHSLRIEVWTRKRYERLLVERVCCDEEVQSQNIINAPGRCLGEFDPVV